MSERVVSLLHCVAYARHAKMSRPSTIVSLVNHSSYQPHQFDGVVLLVIFDQLDYQDLLRCEAVCRQWRNVLLSGTPWRRLFHRKIISSEQWRDIVRILGVDVKKLETVHYRSLCRGIIHELKPNVRNWRNGKFKEIVKCTSKEIRASRTRLDPIQNLKLGINLSRPEAINWGFKLAKLTSIKHRNMLLRVAHGEIYTKEKLHRYNLIDNDRCPRCGEAETLNHKFIECDYVRRIWRYATSLTANLISVNQNQLPVDSRSLVLGSFVESTPTILTLHAEILQRILYLREEQNYLVHPKTLVTHCLKLIARC